MNENICDEAKRFHCKAKNDYSLGSISFLIEGVGLLKITILGLEAQEEMRGGRKEYEVCVL